jgi:hypothetical protein
MKQASRQGVYAQTTSGLVEISRYGAFTVDPFTQLTKFKFDSSIPQVAGPIAFVANIPDAVMSDTRVYLIPAIDAGVWRRGFIAASDTKPLPSSADAVAGSIYKITPELPNDATGFLCLWLQMPSSDADRMYAIQIKK